MLAKKKMFREAKTWRYVGEGQGQYMIAPSLRCVTCKVGAGCRVRSPIEVGSVITHPQFSHVYFRPFIGVVTLFITIVGVHLVETICLL